MIKWPEDNQSALIRFYGIPGPAVERQLVPVIPPFRMTYGDRPIKQIMFHKKAASALKAALDEIWAHYGRDQKKIDELGISKYSGAYNLRMIRGSTKKWSNHAFGAAIDLNAEENGLHTKGNMPKPVIAAFKRQGARWGGDYKGRKDPMHFEFCGSGTHAAPLPPLSEAEQPREAPREAPTDVSAIKVLVPAPVAPVAPQTAPDSYEYAAAKAVSVGETPYREVWSVQGRLKAMNYNPGGIDAMWGGLTGGAISGFINDRQMTIAAPTSIEMFLLVHDVLKAEITEAEGELFKRPIAVERATVTSAELALKLPEVDASIKAKRLGFWGSVAGTVSAVVTGVSKFMGDAIEWLNPVRTFIGDLPWPVWVGSALAVSGALYYLSRKSGQAVDVVTQDFRKGTRS